MTKALNPTEVADAVLDVARKQDDLKELQESARKAVSAVNSAECSLHNAEIRLAKLLSPIRESLLKEWDPPRGGEVVDG